MKFTMPFRKIFRLIQFAVIGSAVITRSAGSAGVPEHSMEHELAWMNVRNALSRTSDSMLVPAAARSLVDAGSAKDLDIRVGESYRAISPEAVEQLDALWMTSLFGSRAAVDVMDTFLAARSLALSGKTWLASVDNAEKFIDFSRVFNRVPYEGG